jgi:hypothetical protein
MPSEVAGQLHPECGRRGGREDLGSGRLCLLGHRHILTACRKNTDMGDSGSVELADDKTRANVTLWCCFVAGLGAGFRFETLSNRRNSWLIGREEDFSDRSRG